MTDVLYIAQEGSKEPWFGDFAGHMHRDSRFDVAVFERRHDFGPQLAGVRVVVDQGGHASREMIDAGAAAGVQLWQVLGTGLDHTEVDHILASGIRLANTPGPFSAIALAEHALFLMLALAKRDGTSRRNFEDGVMYLPLTEELAGRTLGLVGLGASGRELATRAAALGMRVIAVDALPVAPDQLEALGVASFAGAEGLDALLAEADYVSVHVPLTPATEHLIDARRLALMKPTARIVNVSRGRIIDEQALAAAMRSGEIGGAGIDVFGEEPPAADHPLRGLDDVILTPHIAGVTNGTSERRGRACAENAIRVLEGKDPLWEVTAA